MTDILSSSSPSLGEVKLSFRPIAFEDRELILNYQQQTPRDGLNYLWEVMYLYRQACEFELCEWNGFLLIKTFVECTHNFLFPLGSGDLASAIEVMCNYSERHRCPFALFQIREEELRALQALQLPNVAFEPTPHEEEYFYLAERLATLQGKHLQPKRNHINALLKTHECRFEPFDSTNMPEAEAFEREWNTTYFDSSNLKIQMEVEAMKEVFREWRRLGMRGGVVRVDGRVEGFSIGTELNPDTFVVLFEKANPHVRGVYPFLNREFVRAFAQDYTYVNREEDGGDEGLRKAKISYDPLPRRPLWRMVKQK